MFSNDQIYVDRVMKELIERKNTDKEKKGKNKGKPAYGEPHEQPRVAIQRMRAVVGAYLYLKEEKVDKIFVAQVDRIGAQLEHLENALAKTPRTVMRKEKEPNAQGIVEDRPVTYNKWESQKLKEKWFAYMDGVYKNADKKAQEFMKVNLERLNNEYDNKKMIDQKDVDKEKSKDKQTEMKNEKKLRENMKDYIPKLEAAWKNAKNWSKPKWNAKKP